MSIELLYSDIENRDLNERMKVAKRKELAGYITNLVVLLSVVGSQLIPFISVPIRIILVSMGFFLGCIAYTYSVCVLVKLLNQFTDKRFESEIKSIKV